MGVGFQVNGVSSGARWSYSGFNEFRKKVAAEAGIDVKKMRGYIDIDRSKFIDGQGFLEALKEECEKAKEKTSWDTIDDPIKWLLHHSDCEGHLTPEECAQIVPRLRELIAHWPDNSGIRTIDNYDKVNALLLIRAMEEAVRLDLPLEFC